jgi:hypothetical protein
MIADTFAESAEKSAQWLLSRMDDDGRVGPSLFYYDKVPHALLDAGYPTEAQTALNWIEANGMRSDGDFDWSGDPEPTNERDHIWAPRMRPYQNAILVMSGQRLGRFRFSYRAYDRMQSYQDPNVGGFSHSTPGGDELDLVSTGFCGLACLYMRDLDRARMAGDSVLDLLDKQPALDDRLYVNLDKQGELVVDGYPAAGEDFYVVYSDRPDQMYFYAGCGLTLLANLYLATDEQKYLDGALRLYDFNVSCESVFEHGSAGKFAWGCLFLYEATGDDTYLDVSRRIGKFIMGRQCEDGSFDVPENAAESKYTITAEFTMWIAAIARYLE